ncbi:MAG: DegT/DnrJ/EryC1/StrS family aminotransferase [Balneolales bacterium]
MTIAHEKKKIKDKSPLSIFRSPVKKNISVTKTFFPPGNEYTKYLEGIWKRGWVTNNGPLVREFEQKLKLYLGINNIAFVSNGTIALQLAIKALHLKGEIITTPFSYVATTSSIAWEGCKPVFVDIDPTSLNINPDLIEAAITKRTTGILAAHIFGNPCDISAIQKIADNYNLKVIYDAAHCFGTAYKGRSVFEYGDISTTSFHATKLLHTVEGGAVFTKDEVLYDRLKYMRNFGHAGPGKFKEIGINGKNTEFHAAMGLCNLNHIKKILASRKRQCNLYDQLLEVSVIQRPVLQAYSKWNYAYYPILFKSENVLLDVKSALERNNIYPRRYFYPSLHCLDYVYSGEAPVSESAAKRILCLPLFHGLTNKEIEQITTIINDNIHACSKDINSYKGVLI